MGEQHLLEDSVDDDHEPDLLLDSMNEIWSIFLTLRPSLLFYDSDLLEDNPVIALDYKLRSMKRLTHFVRFPI